MTKGIEHNASYEHSPALPNEENKRMKGPESQTEREPLLATRTTPRKKRIGPPTERERVLATKKAA